MAAVTIGFCASGHQEGAVVAQTGHAHDVGAHSNHGDDSPAQPVEPSCNVCAEHCSGAAFAPLVDGGIAALIVGQDRTHLAARTAPTAIPRQLDRPPLA